MKHTEVSPESGGVIHRGRFRGDVSAIRKGTFGAHSGRRNSAFAREMVAAQRKAARDVIGYCGLIDSGRGSEGEPELAFELLRRVWGQGYATEASLAVLDWARSSGCGHLWATVWEWNPASRRVLAKVGFTETERKEVDAVYGTTLFTARRL